LGLSSIEVALLATFNLEMADSYDEIADDPKLRRETRRNAGESASCYRARAELFQLEAQRLSAYPTILAEQPAQARAARYTGPERRKRERRTLDLRGAGPERRKRERRTRDLRGAQSSLRGGTRARRSPG
jgi:hypothetical protein